jgi:hypothetical protein
LCVGRILKHTVKPDSADSSVKPSVFVVPGPELQKDIAVENDTYSPYHEKIHGEKNAIQSGKVWPPISSHA